MTRQKILAQSEETPRPMNIILLGDPASGKGTQSARLAERYGMYDLDMGREVNRPSVTARYDYDHTTAVGKLTPTEVVRTIFMAKIAHTPADRGIVFSGTPKMIGEAKLVERLLRNEGRRDPLVIYLHIPIREVRIRTAHRRVYVHGKPVRRADDNARALENRRRYYHDQIAKVVAFFRARYAFVRISGMGTEDAVAARIEAAIARHEGRMAHRDKKR
jgi:adenylate kinase